MASLANKHLPDEILMVNCATALPPTAKSRDAEVSEMTSDVARGDEAAFQRLYDRYHARLFRLGMVLSRGDEILSHESVQSVMLTAAAKLRALETEEHLWNWLARVARQHLAKAWRRQARDSKLVKLDEVPEQLERNEPDSVLEESLDAAMNALDADDRQVVELFYYERLSCKQIADRLGATPKAVSSRMERARSKLRSLIEKRLRHET